MFDSQQNTSATATSVEHAERKTSNNNLRGGATSSSNLTLSSNERISATDINRDEFHIRERYLSRPSPQNTVRSFLDLELLRIRIF